MTDPTAETKAPKGPMIPARIRNILFVCTGNTCRSPLAEGFLKKLLAGNSLSGMEIGSAGLTALPGSPASFHSLRVALENSEYSRSVNADTCSRPLASDT